MKFSRLFRQTFFILVVLYGVVATATSLLSAYILFQNMEQEFVSKGRAIALSIASSTVETLLNQDLATFQAVLDQYLEIDGVAYVYYADDAGRILSHTFAPAVPPRLRELDDDGAGGVMELSLPGGEFIDVSRPILAGELGYVHVGMSEQLIRSRIAQAVLKQQLLLLAIFLLSVAAMYVLVGRISRPLEKLTDYARRLASHDFEATVDIRSKDEVGLLARTMQSMAEEISALVQGLERAVENATVELTDNLAFMQAVMDNLADGLLVVGAQDQVTHHNPALLQMFAVDPEEAPEALLRDLFPPGLAELADRARLHPERAHVAEVPLAGGRVGKAVATSISSQAPDDDSAAPGQVVLLIRDITSEKEVDRMKTDFISTVSHELRTPLTSVLGFAKIIKRRLEQTLLPALDRSSPAVDRAAEQVEHNAAIIVSEGERLTMLINDVLDISKMESGRLEWRLSSSSLHDLIRRCLDTIRPQAGEKGLELEAQLPDDLPTVHVDRNRIIQVLVNLLSNAVKFTSQGSVRVTAERRASEATVCVEDTGAGVPEEDQERIFERFKQSGDTLSEKPAGTGLGLPICKHIVEAHGGAVWVESEPGRGSRFCFTLPTMPPTTRLADRRPEPSARPAPEPGGEDRAKVLVVDDDPSVRAYLQQTLEEEGLKATTAADGFQALEIARRRDFDLITMDLAMPGMDGRECILRLRAMPNTMYTPILVITAFASQEAEGASAALAKPVAEEELIQAIRSLLSGSNGEKPCVVLTRDGKMHHNDLLMVCTGQTFSCTPGEIWRHLEGGFEGTVLIPASLSKTLDLQRLAASPGVQIIILPEAD
jgi:signal transduction histidine kinase/ActR/RegA family two-component response regulator